MDQIQDTLDGWATSTVVAYPVASMLLIIGLMVVIVLMMLYGTTALYKKEGFMPTALSSQQQSDTLGMHLQGQMMHDYTPNYGVERAEGGRASSAFAQQVQSSADLGYGPVNPAAAPGAPGSPAYQILNAPNYGCATRIPIGTDAWGWQDKVAHENFKGATPSQLSAISQGQR